jgi:hypothetical protein
LRGVAAAERADADEHDRRAGRHQTDGATVARWGVLNE